jgi:hypothetical protein
MRDLSWLANVGMLETVDSKSKSNPSTTEVPKGRGIDVFEVAGPKIDQMLSAAEIASAEVLKPPSEYVDPPTERRIVFPYVDWHSAISALRVVRPRHMNGTTP